MADSSGFGGMSPLSMIYGSQGGQAGMMGLGIDPSLYALQPEMQAAQSGMQTGISTAPVYSPLGGLARAAQAFLGKNMMQDVMGKYTSQQGQQGSQQDDAIRQMLGQNSPAWEYYNSLSPAEKWNFRTKYMNEMIQTQAQPKSELAQAMQDRDRMVQSGTASTQQIQEMDSRVVALANAGGLTWGRDANGHPVVYNTPGYIPSQYDIKYGEAAGESLGAAQGDTVDVEIKTPDGKVVKRPVPRSWIVGGGQGGGSNAAASTAGGPAPPPKPIGKVDAQGNVNAQ